MTSHRPKVAQQTNKTLCQTTNTLSLSDERPDKIDVAITAKSTTAKPRTAKGVTQGVAAIPTVDTANPNGQNVTARLKKTSTDLLFESINKRAYYAFGEPQAAPLAERIEDTP